MNKPYPALCNKCKWSKEKENFYLACLHPIINANDSYALSAVEVFTGTHCRDERAKTGWFTKCGMKGKLWEAK